jgi:hypothetical protein
LIGCYSVNSTFMKAYFKRAENGVISDDETKVVGLKNEAIKLGWNAHARFNEGLAHNLYC